MAACDDNDDGNDNYADVNRAAVVARHERCAEACSAALELVDLISREAKGTKEAARKALGLLNIAGDRMRVLPLSLEARREGHQLAKATFLLEDVVNAVCLYPRGNPNIGGGGGGGGGGGAGGGEEEEEEKEKEEKEKKKEEKERKVSRR